MKLDHAKSIALIILLTITATSSATWYLTSHALSAPTLPSYDYPGSGENHWTYLIYQDTSGKWLRIHGDTRLQDDWSSSDSPVTDPIPLINRAITALINTTGILEVKGDFSSAGTVSITGYFGGYYHYGVQTVTGNNVGVLCNDPRTGYSDYSHTGMNIFVQEILGPVGTAGSNFASYPNSAGVRLQNCMQHIFNFGEIAGFQYGILVDQTVLDPVTGRSIVNDDETHVRTLVNNNYAVRFLGPAAAGPPAAQCEGNQWFIQVIYPNHGAFGIVKDAGLLHQYNQWFYLSMVPVGGASGFFINNPATATGQAYNVGADFILALFWVDNVNNLLQPGDVLIVQNADGTDDAGAFRYLTRVSELGMVQKQLAVSFTTATSKAVSFPVPEHDTSYSIVVTFHQNSGNYWITSLSTTGCTINWSTSSTGTLDYFVYR